MRFDKLASGADTMKTADTYVRARIDSATKERAADALAAMGLTISDAIRLLMLRVVDEHRLPFRGQSAECHNPQGDCATGGGQRKTLRRNGGAHGGPE